MLPPNSLEVGLNLNASAFLQTVDIFRQGEGFFLRDLSDDNRPINKAATAAGLNPDGFPGAPAPEGLTWTTQTGYSRDYRPGLYELTWQGDVKVTLDETVGVQVREARDGFILVEVLARPEGSIDPQGFAINVVVTGGTPPSDFSFYYQADKPLIEAGVIWQPDYVAKVAEAGIVRTMALQGTLNNGVVGWNPADESINTPFGWQDRVPLEAIVELANASGSDLWYNIPHAASDDYVREAATYLRDNLDAGIKVYVEYSNEHWISGGDNYRYWSEQSAELFYGGVPPANRSDNDIFIDVAEFYGSRATAVSQIFSDTFEAGESREAIPVLTALRTQNPSSTTPYLDALWNGPRAAELNLPTAATAGVFEAIGTDAYFDGGFSVVNRSGFRNTYEGLLEVWRQSGADVAADEYFRYMTRDVADFTYVNGWKTFGGTTQTKAAETLAQWGAFANANGLEFYAYEGGTSLTWREVNFGSGTARSKEQSAFGLFLDSLNEDPRMTEIGNRIVKDFAAAGGDLYVQYADLGDNGGFGNWSSYTSVFADQVSLRGAAYAIANATEEGGDAMVGGVGDDRLTGDDGDNVILGNAGNDMIRGGAGADIILGGAGNDNLGGQDGDDLLYGEDGFDTLNGGRGNNVLDGGARKDILSVDSDAGFTRVFGGEADNDADELKFINKGSLDGVNVIFTDGEEGSFTFNNATARGTLAGVEVVFGTSANDVFNASASVGGVQIRAGNGQDTLTGGIRNDILSGEGGNDVINGGLGNDRLSGGGGSDVFVFSQNSGQDVITDFNIAQDRLDLSATGLNHADIIAGLSQNAQTSSAVLTLQNASASISFSGINKAQLMVEDIWIL